MEKAFWLKNLFLIACLLFTATPGFSQNKTVTGTVTDATGEPLIGASVLQQGTSNGVITDIDGKYSIQVPSEATLEFSYVGMVKQAIKVGNRSVIDVQMQDDSQMLAETVVIGYGSAKKRDLTGSITNIKGDEIANKPVVNPVAALQGKIAGVQVINSGKAGADPEIRVRGTNSINGYKPLYVVDGLFNDNINFLNPQDIESMEILKDPSSLAIFGVRGANTGFQDAQSLAWHLAFVIKGLASEKLLANHSAERVGAAREIIDEAGKSTRFMAPPTRGFRVLRDAVLSLSRTQDFVRPLYHWRTSRPHEYTHSMLNSPGDDNALFTAGPAHGAPPQNVRLGADDFLLDHLGGGFDLLYFTDAASLPQPLQDVIAEVRGRGVPVRVTAVGSATPVQGADQTFADADGHFRQRYGISASGGAYLLRPDQHVCARWLTLDATRLQAAFHQALPQ